MKILYFYNNGSAICICFSFRGRTYYKRCRWICSPLFSRFIRRFWYSDARAIRLPEC